MSVIGKIYFGLFIVVLALGTSNAQPVNVTPPGPITLPSREQAPSPVEKVSPGVFRIGDIMLNKNSRSISFPALVNMDKGPLEYLLVHSGGKTHESLFRTKVLPYDLQLAFLLLGFEGADHPLSIQGAPEKPKGEPLEITIAYNKSENKTVIIHPEEWIVKIKENKPKEIGILDWVFTGSLVVEGQFVAQMDGSIIAIYHDPVALIDNASAGGESDEIWFVKEEAVPPVGTPVTIDIKAKTKK